MKYKFNQIFSALNQRPCRRDPVLKIEVGFFEEKEEEEEEEEEEQDVLTQFLKTQKNQPTDLQEHLESYWNFLPVFGSNSAKYDIKIIKNYLLLLLVNEQGFEQKVMKKASQCV